VSDSDHQSQLRLVVGLGNPGAKYAGTRHNVGFMALERLANDTQYGPRWASDEGRDIYKGAAGVGVLAGR
jgi:PTH1 family peptidyl-tRNA hydrolase